jgi:DNA-binding LacI/PurR family transcriptional regulator
MRPTIRQIAQEAGVSHVTVSHVLRGVENRTSPETRAKVLEVTQRLNYLPVKPPTSQNHHINTGMVTLVPEHPDIENHELDLFTYQGMVRGAREHGYDVITMVGKDYADEWERLKARYLDRRSDGFIFAITNQGVWENALEVVAEHGIPSVVCYRRNVPKGLAWVDVDNQGAIQQVMQHLVRRGHKRIAYLAGPPDNFDEKARREAWVEAMQENEMTVHENLIVKATHKYYHIDQEALESVKDLGVTAVVCFNDTLALKLWDVLEAQGLEVPRDISLVGMDNRPEAALRGLSSVSHSFSEVGRLAMEAWMELKRGAAPASCNKIAPVNFVERHSVRFLTEKP